MQPDVSVKVTAAHQSRPAYLYVRQSTPRQVVEHAESTARQYALRARAMALGWAFEQVVVIDRDLGHSASERDREGFQQLMMAVSLGRAGLVMGLEVSRLARNCAEWHRLLELCALTDTLILDEEGLYDPAHFNDRLLLGLKGTMSEVEIHVMRARLRGGLLNKARRGELHLHVPIGLTYDADGHITLDPDQQVRDSLALFFATFRRTGAASAVVRAFRRQQIRFPRRVASVSGDYVWGDLQISQALRIVHNPRYAGAFVFGRTRRRVTPAGCRLIRLPRDQWHTVLLDAHPGYITWPEFEENQRRVQANGHAYGSDRRGPPREGPALLQGLVVCGVCGHRMTVHYHRYRAGLVTEYCCPRHRPPTVDTPCRTIHGTLLDRAVGDLLVDTLTPVAVQAALTVQHEIETRLADTDRLRRAHVERVRYDADLARRRYLSVDPARRLVADVLEADWNQKLHALQDAEQDYQRQREADQIPLSPEQQQQIGCLATDLPTLWRDPQTPDRERKRLLRLLIDDVTLLKTTEIVAHIRFKTGVTHTLLLPAPPNTFVARTTGPDVVAEIDRLLDTSTYREIAQSLNDRGFRSGSGKPFDPVSVGLICKTRGLKSRYQRLRDRGLLTVSEIAARLDVCPETIREWRQHGLLRAHVYNDVQACCTSVPIPTCQEKPKA